MPDGYGVGGAHKHAVTGVLSEIGGRVGRQPEGLLRDGDGGRPEHQHVRGDLPRHLAQAVVNGKAAGRVLCMTHQRVTA